MLAAIFVPGNEKLVLDKNYAIRVLKDDEILLKVAATGVGLSDVCVLDGGSLEKRSFVLGHESCGVPVKLGSKVDKHAVREGKLYSILLVDPRVHGMNGFPALYSGLGSGQDGAFAEYIIATADALVPVPDGVLPTTTAEVKQGDKVLIFGVGGLGHLAVQYAKLLGAIVYVCDFKPAARQLALDLGAEMAFDLIELADKTAAGFTVNKTIDFFTNAQIRPSSYGPREALVTALDLFAKGTVRAHVHSAPLEKVNEVIDQVRAFNIVGRKVVVPHLAHTSH
ncbi:chaperonin 10-like protein [Mycena filopes]|nr:chaperonin 10-like protein [Mycena filopes]